MTLLEEETRVDSSCFIVLTFSQWKQLVQESKEYTCIKKYYTPPKTPKIKSEGGVGIGKMKAEQVGNILELT